MATFANSRVRTITAAMAIIACGTSAFAQNSVVALSEMQTMAQSLELCALDTTRYVSLENLNDGEGTNTVRPYDSIEDQGGPFTIIPQDGYFLPRKNLTVGPNPWRGPYVNYQVSRTQTGTTPYDQGSLLDPWGTPYYLFNPFGLIRGDTGTITQELYGDRFDRYTIVSLGPDGAMGGGDDLSYEFGPGINSTRLTSLNGNGTTLTSAPTDSQPTYDVAAGTTLTLRGYNFGGPSVEKSVVFGDTILENVISASNREVVVPIPQELTGTNVFAVKHGSFLTNGITATIIGGDTAVRQWGLYCEAPK